MRAIVVEEFGGPEVLQLTELPVPEPGPGQVSIDVAYAGVNFAELKARSNGYRVPALPFQPGLEVSGRIRAVGEGVPEAYGLRPGLPVAALTRFGGYADIAVADADTVFAVPEGVSLRTAAALPTVLPTAHALLHEIGRLRAGESVLVQGAAGGVGGVVGQLAKLAGAGQVLGVVSSPAKAEYALKTGYDHVFVGAEFTAEAVRERTGGQGVDLALDAVGGDTFRESLAALTAFGRLVSFGNASGEAPWQLGQNDLTPGRTVAGLSILELSHRAPAELRTLTDRAFALVAGGSVDPLISAELPLTDAAEAHRLIESRTTTGKLLLRVAGE
ncbi:zinc-binding dehydrogenase [Kitasatospora acidiphila]|uniref:Zinc-binding dehydrogenase n=1 Tax=Kitasatospora acidiphila TaxID=2567942 RepID=A0A540W0C7_9ACTN|nr:zinc-binding dehydrogenase [Kitasatospora acidiphila]TQF02427.1 zinc-binding dehydrogenase [Kitasatospora acidiphila]